MKMNKSRLLAIVGFFQAAHGHFAPGIDGCFDAGNINQVILLSRCLQFDSGVGDSGIGARKIAIVHIGEIARPGIDLPAALPDAGYPLVIALLDHADAVIIDSAMHQEMNSAGEMNPFPGTIIPAVIIDGHQEMIVERDSR